MLSFLNFLRAPFSTQFFGTIVPSRALTIGKRQAIAQDTLNRSPSVVKECSARGASLESKFISEQLPPLASRQVSIDTKPVAIEVVNCDSFTAARDVINAFPEAEGKTAVLNLASDQQPAGGWLYTLSVTQEEALCYSSTLHMTLQPSYYPWPNVGPGSVAGVYSSGVVIFKDSLDHGCVDLPKEHRCVVSVISVAAPRRPKLMPNHPSFKDESVLDNLREKIRLVYRIAGHNGQEYLVLGALGCGAYGCPPEVVAPEMKNILLEPEFKGWFRQVVFAVYSNPENSGSRNFSVFKETLDGVEI